MHRIEHARPADSPPRARQPVYLLGARANRVSRQGEEAGQLREIRRSFKNIDVRFFRTPSHSENVGGRSLANVQMFVYVGMHDHKKQQSMFLFFCVPLVPAVAINTISTCRL